MKKNLTIGVLIGNVNSPHTLETLQGIRHAAKEFPTINFAYYLGVHSSHYSSSYYGIDVLKNYDYQFNVVYDYAMNGALDAMIIPYGSIGIFLRENNKHSFLKKFSSIPIILLEDTDPEQSHSAIITDNYNGMYELVQHLIQDHGYKKIAYLSGPEQNRDAEERKSAFYQAMNDAGLSVPPERFEIGDFSDCVNEQAGRLLDNTPGLEALVCANDLMAIAAYEECRIRGLKIGKDIAVTGFDDWPGAASLDPPLTTIRQNSYEMGVLAVKYALDALAGEPAKTTISHAVVQYRSSCGCRIQRTTPKPRMTMYEESLLSFRQKTWFLPLVTKDMFGHLDDEEAFFRSTLDKLPAFNMFRSAIYIFPEPVAYHYGDIWKRPSSMYLAAHSDTTDGQVISYPPDQRPMTVGPQGFASFKDQKGFHKSVFCLFSGEYQYGMMVSEIRPEHLSLAYLISTQIGIALRYLYLSQEQRRTQNRLEKLIEEVNEKNAILNSLSDYDMLSRCLNRRGFLKKANERLSESAGQHGILFMFDLDHLKEINDTFGHGEGDFAIQHSASILLDSLKQYGLIGRIGGDEFVAVIFPPESMKPEDLISEIKESCSFFNRKKERGYYIELSIGYIEFVCDNQIDYNELMHIADQKMYEAKKYRRSSAIRD